MARLFSFLGLLACISYVRAGTAEAEHPLVTPAPNITFAALRERDLAGSICGYLNADPNSPISCEGTSFCTYPGEGYWGCCGALSCSTPGTCEPEGRPYCGGVGSANCVYSQILQWLVQVQAKEILGPFGDNDDSSGASPACVTYKRKTASTAEVGMVSWGCGATPTTYDVFAFTTAGEVTGIPTGNTGTSADSSPTDNGGSTESSGGAPAGPSSSVPSSSPSSSSGGGGLSTDAKIALGVGIPATVAGIGCFVLAYRYRQRRGQ